MFANDFEQNLNRYWIYFAYLLFLVAALASWFIFQNYNKDIDDVLRMVEIRWLLQSGHWRDMTLPMIAEPEPYVSHWSRIVDLLYFLPAKGLGFFMPVQEGLFAASKLVPIVLMGLFIILFLALLRRLGDGRALSVSIAAIAPVLLMPPAIGEFASGRVDHHNVQIVLMLCFAFSLNFWTRRSGFWSAFVAVLSLAVGLETLPIIAVGLIFVALVHVYNPERTQKVLSGLSIGCLVLTPVVALICLGPEQMLVSHVDAFSLVFISALMGFGVIGLFASARVTSQMALPSRFFYVAVPGLVVIALLFLADPVILRGPYAMIDPLSRTVWLNRIGQEKSFLTYFNNGRYELVCLVTIYMILLGLSIRPVLASFRALEYGKVAVYCLALTSILLTLLICRNIRFSAAFIPLFLPMALMNLKHSIWSFRQRTTGLFMDMSIIIALLFSTVVLAKANPVTHDPDDIYDLIWRGDTCDGNAVAQLSAIAPARILAPPIVGLRLIEYGLPEITVAAIPYQRSAAGLKRMMAAFTSSLENERRSALADFDYVAVCDMSESPVDPEKARQQAPLFAGLLLDGQWPGLTPLPHTQDSNLYLFRISHEPVTFGNVIL